MYLISQTSLTSCDIDTDFLPHARDEVKKFAAEAFKEECVCTVGNWNTLKLKQAIQDAARVLEEDQAEAIRLTKSLASDDFDTMDLEDLCENSDEFAAYYENHKDVIELALRLRGRIKSQGQHAGGIIISSVPLADTIPMSYINGKFVSQWTEGMAASQLSKFGLVKFDILGLKTMAYNVYTEELIKSTRGIVIDWDDYDPMANPPYAGHEVFPDGSRIPILLNDPVAIKMADEVKTEAVFQFDTAVAKGVLSNGVTSFMDLVAYTALARPGPMDMIPEYVARRDGEVNWRVKEDPRVVEMLEDTYGIIVFQEQLTKFWMRFGGLTAPEAEAARKSVAKKKKEEVLKLGPKIVANMIKNGFSDAKMKADPEIGKFVKKLPNGRVEEPAPDSAQGWWNKMVTFGRYAFNQCLSKDTLLEHAETNEVKTIEEWINSSKELKLISYNKYNNEFFVDDVVRFIDSGDQEIFEIEFDNGVKQFVTMQHKFMCDDGKMHTVEDIINNELNIVQYDDNRRQQ